MLQSYGSNKGSPILCVNLFHKQLCLPPKKQKEGTVTCSKVFTEVVSKAELLANAVPIRPKLKTWIPFCMTKRSNHCPYSGSKRERLSTRPWHHGLLEQRRSNLVATMGTVVDSWQTSLGTVSPPRRQSVTPPTPRSYHSRKKILDNIHDGKASRHFGECKTFKSTLS